jgi:aspartate/tyrosine/aromatic aminotransferase
MSNFGSEVVEKAKRLAEEGKDANQIAAVLAGADPNGRNYGIGILLDGNGQPMPGSPTLQEYLLAEIQGQTSGRYLNSAKLMDQIKEIILRWQCIPEKYWDHFAFVIPSDSGTGAVFSGIQIMRNLFSCINTLGVEALGWPAYAAMAKANALVFCEYSVNVFGNNNMLPIYQAGPLNTTGKVQQETIWRKRANDAGKGGYPVLLDRAYSGYAYAERLLSGKKLEDVMWVEYETMLASFIEHGVPFALAIGPTKSFVTFNSRPFGFLLVFCPDKTDVADVQKTANIIIRARGSAFQYPASRAFARAIVNDFAKLEQEHVAALLRVAKANIAWANYSQGTSLTPLFTEKFAGIFRNFLVDANADVAIYGKHLYPVFKDGRCRINTTGIPNDEKLARQHVAAFASQMAQ